MNLFQIFSKYFTSNNYDDKQYNNNEVNYYSRNLNEVNAFLGASSIAYRNNVSGVGFGIFANTNNKAFNEEFNEIIDEFQDMGFDGFKSYSNCEITGKYTMSDAERQMTDEYAIKSGGFIIGHHFNDSFKFGYKFEIIPLYLIDTNKTDRTKNIINGIEYDRFGRITSIYIYTTSERLNSKRVAYGKVTLVINKWADIKQNHGVSPFKRVIESLEYIDGYKAKEMDGAGRRADAPIFIKTNHYAEIAQKIREKLRATKKVSVLSAQEELDITREAFSARRIDRKKQQDGFIYIDKDEDIYETGKGVMTIYNDMWNNEIGAASSAIGLSSYSTAGIMPSSYNQALRAAQDEESMFKIISSDIIKYAMQEIIHRFIFACIKKGIITSITEHEFINNVSRYKIDFIRVERGHIDPVKTSKANLIGVEGGWESVPQILKKNGIKPKKFLLELEEFELQKLDILKRVKAKYDDAGIEYTGLNINDEIINTILLENEDE